MNHTPDPLDLELLFETARGFLGLAVPDASARYALLSAMGSCGACCGVYFRRGRGRKFVPEAAFGVSLEGLKPITVTPRIEKRLLTSPGAADLAGAPWMRRDFGDGGTGGKLRALAGIARADRLEGILALGPRLLDQDYTDRDFAMVAAIADLAGRALHTSDSGDSKPSKRIAIPPADRLRRQHPALKSMVGKSAALVQLMEDLVDLSSFDRPVLITGETGTGKELVARAIHDLSLRSGEPFEAANCAAVPDGLEVSMFFGHEKGAFSGAILRARGVFERAGAGTVLLDEVGDLPLKAQPMLLRVLEQGQFYRVGGESPVENHARVLCATNRDLEDDVRAGRFREDLLERTGVFRIHVPALRERIDDLPFLVDHFLRRIGEAAGRRPRASGSFLAALQKHDFPRNIRELEGILQRAVHRARESRVLHPEHLDPALQAPAEAKGVAASRPEPGTELPPADPGVLSFEEMKQEYIKNVLRLTQGNIRLAAALMQEPRTTVNALIRRLDLKGFVEECRGK